MSPTVLFQLTFLFTLLLAKNFQFQQNKRILNRQVLIALILGLCVMSNSV